LHIIAKLGEENEGRIELEEVLAAWIPIPQAAGHLTAVIAADLYTDR